MVGFLPDCARAANGLSAAAAPSAMKKSLRRAVRPANYSRESGQREPVFPSSSKLAALKFHSGNGLLRNFEPFSP